MKITNRAIVGGAMGWLALANLLCSSPPAHAVVQGTQGASLGSLQLAPASALTNGCNFYVLSQDLPPLPFFPPLLKDLDLPVYQVVEDGITNTIVDDRQVDYGVVAQFQQALTLAEGGPPSPGEGGGSESEVPAAAAYVYGANELWLEITRSTNSDSVLLTLHNTHSNLFYQLDSTLNLSNIDWIPGEIVTNTPGLTNVSFAPVSMTNSEMYFRAVASDTLVSLSHIVVDCMVNAFEPNATNGDSGFNSFFETSAKRV